MPRFARVAAAWRPALLLPLLFLRPASARADGPDDLDPDAARRVIEAHAAARAGRRDEARRYYLDAAERVPDAADWLRLRAAMLAVDSSERADLYARIKRLDENGLAVEPAPSPARALMGRLERGLGGQTG